MRIAEIFRSSRATCHVENLERSGRQDKGTASWAVQTADSIATVGAELGARLWAGVRKSRTQSCPEATFARTERRGRIACAIVSGGFVSTSHPRQPSRVTTPVAPSTTRVNTASADRGRTSARSPDPSRRAHGDRGEGLRDEVGVVPQPHERTRAHGRSRSARSTTIGEGSRAVGTAGYICTLVEASSTLIA
jgi:hypothetical protein